MGRKYLREICVASEPKASGRVTVPVLWDKHTKRIVSNESAEIIRMFNSAFDGVTGSSDDYYPTALRKQIDATNDRIFAAVNNGVYAVGFATSQISY